MSRVKYILGSQYERIAATQQTTCIGVCDESDGDTPTNVEWNEFRSNWPNRPYYVLDPFARDGGRSLNIPTDMSTDLNNDGISFGPITVNRDSGNAGNASDWFTICNVESHYNDPSFSGDRELFLFVDNSGSMTTATVRASIELFLSNCANATGGPIEVYAVVNTRENYVDPFITWNGALVTSYAELAALA